MMSVAEALVQHLAQAKIEVVFGLPGGENVQLVEAIRQTGIRFVLVRNESSALFMADATARLTGKPGVALTTLGPGATNAVAGVAHAYLDRTPVILISAETPDYLLAYHTHQVVDLAALFRPITKGTFQVRADNVADLTPHALALTQAGRPGPVHLRLSNEEAAQSLNPSISQSPHLPISPSPHLPISPSPNPTWPPPATCSPVRNALSSWPGSDWSQRGHTVRCAN